jgi:hypothetical protein
MRERESVAGSAFVPVAAKSSADEARDKDAANYDKLFKKEWKALDAALETEPRTAAGAFALLLFTAKYGADCDCINKERYYRRSRKLRAGSCRR